MTRPLVWLAAAVLFAAPSVRAQQPDTVPGLAPLRVRRDTLRIQTPAAFAGRLAPPGVSAATKADRWADSARAHARAFTDRRWRALVLHDSVELAVLAPPPSPGVAPGPIYVEPGAQRGVTVLSRYADLGIQLNAIFDLRYDQLKNLRCTALDANQIGSGCRTGFNPPRIDPQFNIRTGGVVGERIHVNVDYDTQREFDASNNIQVFYQGLEDEVLRRVEVGNVTFNGPRSRFITGGIPANNFGVAVQGTVGALDFGTLFAQQKGNVGKARVFSIGDQTVQPVDRIVADRDFEAQRFFWVRNPLTLPGYPAIDILNLIGTSLPDSLRVTQVRIYRYRSVNSGSTVQTNLSGVPAVARRKDSAQRAGPVNWEVLVEGRDYYLDPSSMWFALTQRLDELDFLAVSYITARGDTVGTFPAVAQAGRTDTLELIAAPHSGADVPTFFYELRNVYRVGSNDIPRTSVNVQLLVGGSQRPDSSTGSPTFLKLLGLALQTDATTFDQYNRLFPRSRDPGNGAPLHESFVVFPNVTPFADSRLSAQYRTDSLYRTPAYLLRTQGPSPLYQVSLHYDAKGGDNRGTLMLGGYQIRQGSERVTAAGRQLTRNVEYTINYEVGQITFVNPDSLFRQPTQVTVVFEENQAFAVAPTSIYGLTARYDLGDHGSISALGLLQRQKTTFTRPPLGFEPSSNFVAGITGNFRFEPLRLTRMLDALPLIHTETPSLLTLDAEIATSRPSPNQVGVAYVETFEGEAGTFLPLGENLWNFGSRPSSGRGLTGTGIDPVLGFSDADAVALTWQNLVSTVSGRTLQLGARDIDPLVVTQGAAQSSETVLWLALHPDTVGGLPDPVVPRTRWLLPRNPGRPRWRSLTLPLSPTGIDLTRTEFLEFWVLEDSNDKLKNNGTSLIFDFGTVYEDAVDFLPTQFTVSGRDTTYTGRRRVGEGRLDTERDTLTGAFNASLDDNGILGDVADSIRNADNNTIVRNLPLCTSPLGAGLVVYDWGSLFTRCTRHNGTVDTEDLNNDQHLDTLVAASGEHHFRYVFKVGDPRYHVRDGGTVQGIGQWRLYRIPFRADTFQVGGPDLRQVRALRVTVAAPGTVAPESTLFFALARMRLVGAPWVKRAGTPIAGLSGLQGQPHGEVIASVVTTENKNDLGYEPPPGVTDEGSTISSGLSLGGVQINEKSLRLIGNDVRVGERAEAFFRFPEGERNFLGYRQMRVWARGRGSDWDMHHLAFFVKVGQDENNFYEYRTNVGSTTWLPEIVVDFQQWFLLRARIEDRFLKGQPKGGPPECGGGGDTTAYYECSNGYLVYVRNPAIAPPNLTRVQELAVGLARDSGLALDSAELWVDDIRLSGVVNDAGYAGAVNLALTAADVADVNVQLAHRDGNFRQLGENPSFVGQNDLALASTIRLDRLGLEHLGITAPLTIRVDHSSQDPFFLNGTDVLASGLSGLRKPSTGSVTYGISIRRSRRGTEWWQRAITDNLGFTALFSSGNSQSELARSTSGLSDVRVDYSVAPRPISFRWVPSFIRDALDHLPGFLKNSDLVRGLKEGRFQPTPNSISFSSGITRTRADRTNFLVPIAVPFDHPVAVVSSTAVLRSSANVDLRPFTSMALGASLSWDRDLKDYGDSTTIGVLTRQGGRKLAGLNVGFVRQRTVTTRFNWAPPLASWVRPRMSFISTFSLSRDPNAAAPERSIGDTAGAFRLPTTFGNGSTLDLAASVDLSRMLRNILGDSSGLKRALDRITQLDFARTIDRRSQFNRPGFDPGMGYTLGLGGAGAFTSQQGRLADAALESDQGRVSAGMRLPLNFLVTTSYSQRTATTWYLRGTEQQLQRTTDTDWPNVTTRWTWTPPRSGSLRKVLAAFSAGAGYDLRTSASEVPKLGAIETDVSGLNFSQRTRSTPFNFSVSWTPGITTSLTRTNEHSQAERTGNTTLGDRTATAADATFTFRPPQDILPLKSDIRTSLRFGHSLNTLCIERVGSEGCVPIADSRRTEYNLTMDTNLPPSVTAGLAVSYVLTDERQLNRKFAQFTLTASVRVAFAAGEIR